MDIGHVLTALLGYKPPIPVGGGGCGYNRWSCLHLPGVIFDPDFNGKGYNNALAILYMPIGHVLGYLFGTNHPYYQWVVVGVGISKCLVMVMLTLTWGHF